MIRLNVKAAALCSAHNRSRCHQARKRSTKETASVCLLVQPITSQSPYVTELNITTLVIIDQHILKQLMSKGLWPGGRHLGEELHF